MEEQMIPAPSAGEPQPVGVGDAIDRVLGGQPATPELGPYDDDKKLLDFYTTFRDECLEDRTVYEREWWRKLMYILGRQWIYFDRKRGQWQDKRLTKWTPKPVTNITAETVDVIRSVFSSVQLGLVARPNGQDPRNVAAAELADDLEPLVAIEHDMKRTTRESDFWLASIHNVFWHVWWDKNSETNGTVVIPHEVCAGCQKAHSPAKLLESDGKCPDCGMGTFTPQQDDDGNPMGEAKRVGKGATDVCSPFEVLVPPTYTKFGDVPGVIRQRWRTARWWKEHYEELAKTLVFAQMPTERSLQLVRSLSTQTDVSGSPLTAWAGGGDAGKGGEGLAEYELWYKPCPAYPEGLFMRVAGDSDPKIVRDPGESSPGPLPYSDNEGRKLFPWVFQQFQQFGGRLWGKGPIDLILQKQDQINQIDSLIQMIIQRVANPIWLKPKGAEVQSFTGEPGLVVEWNPLAAGGAAKPERIPGENVPPSLMQIRKQYLDDVERLSGSYDILRGSKPAGVEAFSALQLLVERSQSRFGLALQERGDAYRQWYGLALELERQYGPQERTWASLGPNRRWTFRHFQNANLQGTVEIVVEDGSTVPKTNLGKRAAIEQANQLRMIDPKDPDQRYAIFKDFGITHLLPGLDVHVKAALQEQDEFEQWVDAGSIPPVPMVCKKWHDDAVHIAEHRKWANADRVNAMLKGDPALEAVINMHLDLHERQAMLKEMPPAQRAQFEMGKPAGPAQVLGQMTKPPVPQGAALALAGSNRESGATGAPPMGQADPEGVPMQQGV
jgi:hypothetical protein